MLSKQSPIHNSSLNPDTTPRMITVTVYYGTNHSEIATKTIALTSINNPLVINTTSIPNATEDLFYSVTIDVKEYCLLLFQMKMVVATAVSHLPLQIIAL